MNNEEMTSTNVELQKKSMTKQLHRLISTNKHYKQAKANTKEKEGDQIVENLAMLQNSMLSGNRSHALLSLRESQATVAIAYEEHEA